LKEFCFLNNFQDNKAKMPQSFKPIDLSRLKTYATGVIEKISG
jgi:hypothetical protein